MNDEVTAAQAADQQDAAWCSVPCPLAIDALKAFCMDTERLLRINPLYEFDDWQVLADNHYRFVGKNLSNDRDIDMSITVETGEQGIDLVYGEGLKQRTELRFKPNPAGSELHITECYAQDLTDAEREARIGEVDHSLVPWAKDLQEYLLSWKRWGWCPPWRWYMRRIWQPMKPSARRISYMLIWITVAEIIAFLLVFLVFWLELDTYFNEL